MRDRDLSTNLERLDGVIEPMLSAARVPGAAIAVVHHDATVFSRAFGYRDLQMQLALTPQTVYPIASTSKAINATLLAMLVDEGKLAWDVPVQRFMPGFRLRDSFISTLVTLRDLVAMRTGLPRHDWMWVDHPISRAELVERLRYLETSAGFRERFQYNNVTATAAGHIAEIVTGEPWEDLVRKRILGPLKMVCTSLGHPARGEVTVSYHEDLRRKLVPTRRLGTEVTAPSGGAIHSNVEDMARWVAFNLGGGKLDRESLIEPETLRDLHSPWVVVGAAPESISRGCAYGGGWVVDSYNGRPRVSHGGYLHDVSSDIALFPEEHVGVVSFINFGFPRIARLINEHVFDLINGLHSSQTLEQKLAANEKKRTENQQRKSAAPRVPGTLPSHAAADYMGTYTHPAYGRLHIEACGQRLSLRRNELRLPLEHWHYDEWFATDTEFFTTHEENPFDCANRVKFDVGWEGSIAGISIRFEPAVAPIRFIKQQDPLQ